MKVMFGSVIYPKSLKYFDEFYESILKQTYQKFDLVLINDGIKGNPQLRRQDKIINGQTDSIVGLRVQLLNYAIFHDYDLLVIGDSDDCFHEKRVENTVRDFDSAFCFFYNNILNMDKSNYFCTKLPETIVSHETIDQSNFLGLSNTAINISKLKQYQHLLDVVDVLAFDWYLFSVLLLNGAKGKYIENTATYYRAHDGNYSNQNDENKLLEIELQVKEKHYRQLKNQSSLYKNYYDSILKILKGSKKHVENKNKCGYWWENIYI